MTAGRRRACPRRSAPRPARARWWWPCAPSTTPCPGWATPAATTSSPPPRWGPDWPWPAWPTSSGLTVRVLGTPAEEGGGGKVRCSSGGVFDDVHAAMMVHPWPDRPARGHLPGRVPLRRALHRADGPRLGRPVGGGQRRRRHDRLPGGHRPAAPAAAARRPGARDRDRRRRGGEHHPRRPPRRYMCRSLTIGRLERARAPGAGLLRGRGPGHRRHGARRARWRPSTPTWRATGRCSGSTGPTPRPWAARSPSTTTACPAHAVHRHGQRVPGRAHHPPAAGHRRRGVRSTTSRGSPRPASPPRPTGPSATAPWPWPGRRSTPPARPAARPPAGRLTGGPSAVGSGPGGGLPPVASAGCAWQTACRRGRGVPGTRHRAAEERDA